MTPLMRWLIPAAFVAAIALAGALMTWLGIRAGLGVIGLLILVLLGVAYELWQRIRRASS